MHRDTASPFGTSFIDLLVGALAMVAMLWAMNAANSGKRGTGEEETASGVVLVEQFGTSHIMGMRVGQANEWQCKITVKDRAASGSGTPRLEEQCHANNARYTLTQGTRSVRVDGGGEDGLEVGWGLATAPDRNFRETATLRVRGLKGSDVEAAVQIAPCCHGTEPHYVRVMTVSGAGHSERTLLWHETGKLEDVLKKSAQGRPWVEALKEGMKSGDVRPKLVGFNDSTRSCHDVQNATPWPEMKVVFEPEGDVQVEVPDTGNNPQVAAFAARLPSLLTQYAAKP